jgi:hypothetical protein
MDKGVGKHQKVRPVAAKTEIRVYTETSRPGYRMGDWRNLFRSPRPGRAALMNAAEQQTLTRLPRKFRVYRGSTVEARYGIAWSKTALFDRKHRPGTQHLWTFEADKADTLAFFKRREEQEVIILGGNRREE